MVSWQSRSSVQMHAPVACSQVGWPSWTGQAASLVQGALQVPASQLAVVTPQTVTFMSPAMVGSVCSSRPRSMHCRAMLGVVAQRPSPPTSTQARPSPQAA